MNLPSLEEKTLNQPKPILMKMMFFNRRLLYNRAETEQAEDSRLEHESVQHTGFEQRAGAEAVGVA